MQALNGGNKQGGGGGSGVQVHYYQIIRDAVSGPAAVAVVAGVQVHYEQTVRLA